MDLEAMDSLKSKSVLNEIQVSQSSCACTEVKAPPFDIAHGDTLTYITCYTDTVIQS